MWHLINATHKIWCIFTLYTLAEEPKRVVGFLWACSFEMTDFTLSFLYGGLVFFFLLADPFRWEVCLGNTFLSSSSEEILRIMFDMSFSNGYFVPIGSWMLAVLLLVAGWYFSVGEMVFYGNKAFAEDGGVGLYIKFSKLSSFTNIKLQTVCKPSMRESMWDSLAWQCKWIK